MLCTATRLGPSRCPTNHELRDSSSSPLALLSSSLPSLLLPLNSAGLLGLEYKQSPTRTCVCVCTWVCKLAGCLVYTRACVLCVHTCIHVGWCACMHACMVVLMCANVHCSVCAHANGPVRVHACMHGALCARVHAFSVHTSLVPVCPCAFVQVCACMRPCE